LTVFVLVLLAGSGSVRAQGVSDAFAIERFRLALDRDGLLDVDTATVPGHLSWSAGLWFGFAHDPLVVYDRNMATVESLVEQRFTTGLVGSLALWDRIELGIALDLVGHQAGAEDLSMRALTSAGLGDLRVVTKVALLDKAGVHVAVIPTITIPMGDARGYLRERGVTFAPELAISSERGRFRVAANAGYRFRERLDVAGLAIDDEAFARAGIGVTIGPQRDPIAELALSISAAVPVRDASENQTAIEVIAGGARRMSKSLSVFVAGGAGLDNGFGTPDWRAIAGVRFDSVRGDPDGDGLEGAVDRCPDQPEDRDGFEDGDGCPDPDNDRDGLADLRDRCPGESEDRDGFDDADGCPDPDNDGDGIADTLDTCPTQAEDKDGFQDTDGCGDPAGQLEVLVLGAGARPIPGASVIVKHLDHPEVAPIELTAGEDGRARTAVHGGALEVAASVPEYQPGQAAVTVRPTASGNAVVTLARVVRQGQLRGQVLSFNGKPLAATILVAGGTTKTETATAGEGMFAVELPAGAVEVTIESAGHATQRRTVNVKLDGVTVLNVDMRRAR